MSVGPLSRNQYTRVVRVVNVAGELVEREHVDLRPRLVRVAQPDNSQAVVRPGDNWSRVSWRTLGHGRHWWIIADYNEVVDPWAELRGEEKLKYVAQLSNPLTIGLNGQADLTRVRGIRRGTRLRIEDMDPTSPTSVDVTVMSVNTASSRVVFSATDVSATIPTVTSKVSIVRVEPVTLTVPSPHRAFFEALDFTNPLNVLVE